MEQMIVMALGMMVLVPVVALVALFLTLKIFRVEKPSFLIWAAILFGASIVSNILGTALSLGLSSLPIGLATAPAWIGIGFVGLIDTGLAMLIMNKMYQVDWKQTLKVVLTLGIIAIAVGNGFSALATRTLFSEVTATDDGMAPQLVTGDRMSIMKLGKEIYKRDAIVLLHNTIETKTYVRRIVGMPGDTIEIKNGKLFINDKEAAVPENNKIFVNGVETDFPAEERDTTTNVAPVKLASDEYFVLSDNSSIGNDSRTLGPVKAGGGDIFIDNIVSSKVTGKSIFDKDGIGYLPVE